MAPRSRWRGTLSCVAAGVTVLALAPVANAAPVALADYEAEDATIAQGVVESNHAGFTGRGFVNYNNLTGSYVEWTVNGPGAVDLTFRFANGTTVNRPMDISVNGTVAASGLAFNGTGAWTTWQTQAVRATLAAGENKIRATATTANGGPNVDKLIVNVPDGEPPTAPPNLRSTGKTHNSTALAWDAASDNIAVTAYDVQRNGQTVQTVAGNTLTANVGGLQPDTEYTWTVIAKDAAGNASPASNSVVVRTNQAPPNTGVPNPGPVTTIASGVDVVWGVAFLPDGSALFSERNSFNIYRIAEGGTKQLAGKISQAVGTGGEGGLLGIELSPTFAQDNWVYVYHTAAEGNRIIRIKYENGQLVQSSYQILLQGIAKSRFHNGGRLRFGPDGKLYASVGDAQTESRAQDNNSLNGKILRINADGTVPSDNPFGNAVWSKGHRNPQGLDFDSQGRLWSSEFGAGAQDEVNLITRGGNFGWPACEGTTGSCGGFIAPKKTWSTSQASPSGLTIINDHVFVATTVGQRVYRMRIDSNSSLVEQQTYFQGTYNRLRTVEVDHQGDIWLTTSTDKDGTANNDRILHIDIQYSGGGGGEFKLSSSAFADNAMMPAKYTCAGDGTAGQDPSPPLAWGADANAKSYAIVFSDRVNDGNKRHWIIWDIPAATQTLPENLGAGFTVPNQGGAKQKAMGSGANAQKYFGPCPGGSTNPYTFTLYAVNVATLPGVTSSSALDVIQNAIVANSGANTVLRGRSNASA